MSGDLIGGLLVVPAMHDTAVCLSVLATAASWLTVRAGLPLSVHALTLHTQAIQSLRERLYLDPTRITDGTLLAAILIWTMELMQSSLLSIGAHAKSVHSLIRLRGGLLALSHAPAMLQLIISVDALTSHILEEEMRFTGVVQEPNPSNLDLPKRKYGELIEQSQAQRKCPTSKHQDTKPGSALNHTGPSYFSMTSVDPELARTFMDSCRATELLEDALVNGISYPLYQHAMTLLNYIMARMAVIHARYKSSKTWDRCICIALNIYHLITFHPGEYSRPFPLRLCARLRLAIDLAKSSNVALSNEISLWIACVVAIVPHEFEDRDYFMDLLWRAITTKFNCLEWPSGWNMAVHRSLRSIVWSDTRHAPAFDKVCRELQQRAIPTDLYSRPIPQCPRARSHTVEDLIPNKRIKRTSRTG
jgi:hypothetical protein